MCSSYRQEPGGGCGFARAGEGGLEYYQGYNRAGTRRKQAQERQLFMTATRETIEVTAGGGAAELKGRSIGSDEKGTLPIEPEQEINPGRRASRARVVAAGLTDDDIDR